MATDVQRLRRISFDADKFNEVIVGLGYELSLEAQQRRLEKLPVGPQ